MKQQRIHYWSMIAPFTLALVTLLLLIWVVWQFTPLPYSGVFWEQRTGIVERVDPEGPASGWIEPGDQIVAIDNVPFWAIRRLPLKQVGETLDVTIVHNGVQQMVMLGLTSPPRSVFLLDLMPFLIALPFWLLSVAVIAFSPAGRQRWLVFVFGQVTCVMLTVGAISAVGPLWTARLFGVLAWWFGPLAILFHLHFPTVIWRSAVRWVTAALCGVALLGSLPELLGDPVALRAELPLLYTLRMLWLAAGLLGVVLTLVQTYRHAPSPATQRRIGVVSIGGAVAFLPLLTLSLLPSVLLGQPLLPYEFAFLFLLLLPLTYGYAIFRYRLVQIDRYVSRGAATILVITLLGAAYLTLYTLLLPLLPENIWRDQLMTFVIAMLMAVTVGPTHRAIQRLVNRVLYGGWYDYRSAVQSLSQSLDQVTDSTALAENLCEAVQTVVQLEWASLVLLDRSGAIRTQVVTGAACVEHGLERERQSDYQQIIDYFRHQPQPVDGATLRALLGDSRLSSREQQLLECAQTQLWLPLTAAERLVGLFVLGPKRGSYKLDATDHEILQTVGRQASISMQNLQLIAELRQRALDSERLHQQLLRAREDERARVARELHDEAIQDLIGLNYHLAELRNLIPPNYGEHVTRLQEDVRQIVGELRDLCADLRPPALDNLGLVAALRFRVRTVQQQATFQIRLLVQGDEDEPLPEEVALCLFRAVQEALNNAQKHALPSKVEIRLALSVEDIWLSIVDDGRGFRVPTQLERLLDEQHFGLIGLRERLELVQGTLDVLSAPGQGTQIRIWVPLQADAQTPYEKDLMHDRSLAVVE
ncbi:MAG: GAF domain-containing protein [Chloroflexi bacterium]|nr:GAF domain-containing protein [Chloroflexota bacterium]